MNATVSNSRTARLLETLENTPIVLAKADLQKIETWKATVGRAVTRCWELAGLTQKQAAALLDCDQAQVGRWENGKERPQFDRIFAVVCLRRALIVALAELAGEGVDTETTIRIRRQVA